MYRYILRYNRHLYLRRCGITSPSLGGCRVDWVVDSGVVDQVFANGDTYITSLCATKGTYSVATKHESGPPV